MQYATLGIAVLTFVVFMQNLSRLFDLIVRNSAPLPSVAEIFFLTLPTALMFTIPMGVLVGILLGLSRMATDTEITAMRASGVGAVRITAIVALFAFSMWLVALINGIWVAPNSAAALVRLQDSLLSSQANMAVQPRVFYEDLPNKVLYVQDVKSASGAGQWSHVFLADITDPKAPNITLAENAIVQPGGENTIRLRLINGAQHATHIKDASQYDITTFNDSDIPITLNTAETPLSAQRPAEIPTALLLDRMHQVKPEDARSFAIEFHRRFALPSACLVLALVAIPLGMSSKKGGKATGFILTIALVFSYYLLSLAGVAMARQGKISAGGGVWLANGVFLLAGLYLLYRADRSSLEVGSMRALVILFKDMFKSGWRIADELVERRSPIRMERTEYTQLRFPVILDRYLIRSFLGNVLMVLAGFVVLLLVFTFFELIGDIIRNRVPLVTVGQYLINVTPFMVYSIMPLCVLISVLVTFGGMQKSNELTAMMATGISIYRATLPVLLMAAVIAGGLFVMEQTYLPYANTRQDALRNTIKGRPPQTFLRPDRKWIFGQKDTIYYYEHFDTDQDTFLGVTAFQFDPKTFAITRRVYAQRAHWETEIGKWIFERGWSREFKKNEVQNFQPFEVATFAEYAEPPTYFKKEVRQSQEMNYQELARYIGDLQQSGFDVVRLRVQLYKKVAYPLICFVMTVLALPFSLLAGRKSTLTGVAVAIGLFIVYYITGSLSEAIGNVNQLPAAIAAWAPDLIFGLAGGYLYFRIKT